MELWVRVVSPVNSLSTNVLDYYTYCLVSRDQKYDYRTALRISKMQSRMRVQMQKPSVLRIVNYFKPVTFEDI